jgi:hypothetical protein
MRFTATPVCDTEGGGECVECVGTEDCAAAEPICENHACRAAATDDECPSGALGTDGICVDEANAVYLAPQGTDAGTCSRAAPCQDYKFAVKRASTPVRVNEFETGFVKFTERPPPLRAG